MLILLEGQANYGSLYLKPGERVIVILEDKDKEYIELYPGLTKIYFLKDILNDKTHSVYTEYMKLILKNGTIL